MTVRVLPKPGMLSLTLELACNRSMSVSSLRRTDEFLLTAKWFEILNHPLSLRSHLWTDYMAALNAHESIFVTFNIYPTVHNAHNGILVERTEGQSISLRHMFDNWEVGEPLPVTQDELDTHKQHVAEMITFLRTAAENVDYPIVKE